MTILASVYSINIKFVDEAGKNHVQKEGDNCNYILFKKDPKGGIGHFDLLSPNKWMASNKNNCGYAVIGKLIGKEPHELRKVYANLIKNHPEQHEQIQKFENL